MEKKEYIKKVVLFVIALLPFAVIGGFFTGVYGFEELMPDMQQMILEQVGSKEIFYVIATLQTITYAVVMGALGYILSQKLGLMRPLRIEKKPVITTVALTLVCGIILSTDNFLFSKQIPQIAEMYTKKPSFEYWMASVFYGGVIEEVMMRLFVMSLLSFVMWKLFFRKSEAVPTGVLIAANMIAALLFAAGHLPATVRMFGEITPLILFRCFLFNSMGGLCFGYLYRKHGIHYAMMSHAGAHIVWKILWVLFI